MVRMNITLPEGVAQELGHVKNKSRFIAEAVHQKFQAEQKRRLEKELVEGYKAQAAEDKRLNQVWESATLENWE